MLAESPKTREVLSFSFENYLTSLPSPTVSGYLLSTFEMVDDRCCDLVLIRSTFGCQIKCRMSASSGLQTSDKSHDTTLCQKAEKRMPITLLKPAVGTRLQELKRLQ